MTCHHAKTKHQTPNNKQGLVYDCDSNDLVSIHDSSTASVGSHHWVVDNVMVGNAGAEQAFDFASGGQGLPNPAYA